MKYVRTVSGLKGLLSDDDAVYIARQLPYMAAGELPAEPHHNRRRRRHTWHIRHLLVKTLCHWISRRHPS